MASLRGGLEQRCDLTGLPLTCSSDEALEWYNKALVAHVSYRENPVPFVTRALELDESLLLGHCLLVSSAAAGNTSSQNFHVLHFVGTLQHCIRPQSLSLSTESIK